MENQLSSVNNKRGIRFGIIALGLFLAYPILVVLGIFLQGGESVMAELGAYLGFVSVPLSIPFGIIAIIFGMRAKKEGKKSALLLGIIYLLLWIGGFALIAIMTATQKPLPGAEYKVKCVHVYYECLNKTTDTSICVAQERECLVNFQNQGVIPPRSVDYQGLNKQMTKLVKGGIIKKWEVSPDETTLMLYVNNNADLSEFENQVIKKGVFLKTYDVYELDLAFSKFVYNGYGDNCVEIRTLDERVIRKDCGQYNP